MGVTCASSSSRDARGAIASCQHRHEAGACCKLLSSVCPLPTLCSHTTIAALPCLAQHAHQARHHQHYAATAKPSPHLHHRPAPAGPVEDERAGIVAGTTVVPTFDIPNSDDKDEGIPEFWLTAMSNHDAIGGLISDRDADVLAYLRDVRCGPAPAWEAPHKALHLPGRHHTQGCGSAELVYLCVMQTRCWHRTT